MKTISIELPPDGTNIDEFCASLPDDARVCEVGGGSSRHGDPNYVIDLISFQEAKVPPNARVRPENWIVQDICSTPWPLDADSFDFIICSHTLEDVRDPIRVAEELMRLAPAGYVETPG